jgi:hypothetical protein
MAKRNGLLVFDEAAVTTWTIPKLTPTALATRVASPARPDMVRNSLRPRYFGSSIILLL